MSLESETGIVNATEHGVAVSNTGEENSKALQYLIDELSDGGGTIYIPNGEYLFAENGTQTIGSHCVKMRSNVVITGDGESTVLKPTGHTAYGLDMFYFNEYLDTESAVYLENCRFENFVIDATDTSCETYTSAGKGFMFNLFKNCHWTNVTVKYTDATGFGVDCPVDSTITSCTAIGCGKAATEQSSGASGFGIGFGYCENESISIKECRAVDNKKFGFFFEHQGRFDSDKYSAEPSRCFTVTDCTSSGNLFGFGGLYAMNTVYENCTSDNSGRYGFLFENSTSSSAVNCRSQYEKEASYAVYQNDSAFSWEVSEILFTQCVGNNSPTGVKIISDVQDGLLLESRVENCRFDLTQCAVYTSGMIHSLTLTQNVSDTLQNQLFAQVASMVNSDNSWN